MGGGCTAARSLLRSDWSTTTFLPNRIQVLVQCGWGSHPGASPCAPGPKVYVVSHPAQGGTEGGSGDFHYSSDSIVLKVLADQAEFTLDVRRGLSKFYPGRSSRLVHVMIKDGRGCRSNTERQQPKSAQDASAA